MNFQILIEEKEDLVQQENNMEDVTKWYKQIPYEFLQVLIDMYVERNRCDKSFRILLDEKLKRNEIYG